MRPYLYAILPKNTYETIYIYYQAFISLGGCLISYFSCYLGNWALVIGGTSAGIAVVVVVMVVCLIILRIRKDKNKEKHTNSR